MKSTMWLLGLAAALVVFCSCRSDSDAGHTDGPIAVIGQRVAKKPIASEISLSGSAAGRRTVRLGFMVGGKVAYIAGEEGTSIASGQLLACLDSTNYRLGFDIADAALHQAEDEHQRLSSMYETGSLSPSDYEKISTTLKQAQAQQRLAAKNLSDTRLIAPISGVLLKRLTEPGEIISQGMPLFVLATIDTIKIEASVPEDDLRRIKLGQSATVLVTALDTNYAGIVTQVGSAADPATRSYLVKINVVNPGFLIRPGMLAEVKIGLNEQLAAIVLPGESVLRDPDRVTYIYVVDTQKGQAFRRPVTVGRLIGNNIEILSGLSENELVVTGGQQRLHDGAAVRLEERQP